MAGIVYRTEKKPETFLRIKATVLSCFGLLLECWDVSPVPSLTLIQVDFYLIESNGHLHTSFH